MVETRSLHDVLKSESYISVLKKNNDRIFSLTWNIVYWLLKSYCFEFFGSENMIFFEPKSWWKYGIYWLLKSSCFELSGNGKYSLFWEKKLMERWYLLITEMFLFWTFRDRKYCLFWGKKLIKRWYLLVTEKFLFWAFPWWKMRSFLKQKVNGKMIFTDYWKVLIFGYRKGLVLSFSVMENMVFFKPKCWCKGNIYLVFLSFPWYSRTWEIRFFVQSYVRALDQIHLGF